MTRSLSASVMVVLIAGCGRIGYDASSPRDAAVDLAVPSDASRMDATDDFGMDANVDAERIDMSIASIRVAPTAGLSTTEAGGADTFTIVLDSQPTSDVTIGLTSSNPAEGTVSPAMVVFTVLNWNAPRTVTVTGVDDVAVDGDSLYTIETAPAISSDTIYSTLDAADVSVTNVDNESAGVTVSPTSMLETTEGGGTDAFTIVLNAPPTEDVVISLTSDTLLEATVAPASLTFTPTDWDAEQTVTVTGVDDLVRDGDATFTIVTGAVVSDDGAYSGASVRNVVGVNLDDETPGVLVSPAAGLVTSESGDTATFTVVLQAQPASDVTVPVLSSDASEGVVSATPLTFTPTNWDMPQPVVVTGVDDAIADGDQVYSITSGPATSTDVGYEGLSADSVSVTNTDDESAGFIATPLSGLLTSEGGAIATFTVVLRSEPSASVLFAVASNDTTEGTVAPSVLSFNASNWDAPQTVTVTGVNDPIADGDIAYTTVVTLLASGDSSYAALVGSSASVSVTNVDDETAGVTVTPTAGLVTSEAGTSDTFTVVLNSQPTDSVSVGFSSDTLSEGTVSPASVVFSTVNWATPRTVTVTGVSDSIDDGDRVYHVVTAGALSSDSAYSGLMIDDVTVTNIDDDTVGVMTTPASGLTTSETGTTAPFTIALSSAPTAGVTFALSSSDVSEGTVSPASLTFTTGDWSSAQTVTVTGVDDAITDGDILYSILTAAGMSADSLYNGFDTADIGVTNIDNEVASVVVTPTASLVTTETGGMATFTVVLSAPPAAPVTISLASSDATEGTVAPASVMFSTMNWSTPQTVTVTGVDDMMVDGSVVYSIVTGAATSADGAYNGLAVADVAVTNSDNDTPGATVSPTSGLTTTEAMGTASFTVVLVAMPSADVTVALATSDATEGSVSPASLVFTTADWNVAQTVTVTGVDDSLDDGNIAYSIITGNAVSADSNYNGLVVSDVSLSNVDNDSAGVAVSPTSGLVTTEAGGFASFTIVLLAQPSADVSISLTSNDTTEGTVAPASVSFSGLNWNIAQTITVTGVDDSIDDGNVAYSVVTGAASSADSAFNGLAVADVAITNSDNDTAGVTVTPTSGLTTTEAGGTAMFTLVLDSQPTANVSISISSNDTTEGTVSPSSVLFNTSNWNTPRTITVTGVNDTQDDGDILFSVLTGAASSSDPAYSGRVVADVTVTNINDDISGVPLTPQGGTTTSENGDEVVFDYRFTVAAGVSDLTVIFTISDPTEAVIVRGGWGVGPVYLAPELKASVIIRGVDDFIDDGDVPYTLSGLVTSTDPNYDGLVLGPFALTNTDNDSTDIIVSPNASIQLTETGGQGTASVVLARAPTSNVVVGLSSADTGEATVSPASLTFTTGNWNTPRTVTMTGVADGILDGDQTVSIVTAAATSADASFNGVNAADISAVVIDIQAERCASINLLSRPAGLLNYPYTSRHGRNVLSDDGRYVAFQSTASNIVASGGGTPDAFRRDRVAHTTTCSSVTSAGADANTQAQAGADAQISGDGRFVAFGSNSVIVAGDTNSVSDVYVRDHTLGTSQRISVSDTGAHLNVLSTPSGISSNGRYVLFETTAAAVADDTNGVTDIFVRDTMLNTTVRASVSSTGTQGTLASTYAVISGDGRYVAFQSANVFTGVSTPYTQIYIRDLVGNTTTFGAYTSTGAAANSGTGYPQLSFDGRYLGFVSTASNMVPSDTNGTPDVFVRDVVGATTTRANLTSTGAEASARAEAPSISNDGQRVVFASRAALVPADTNDILDFYVRDFAAGTTLLVSVNGAGQPQNWATPIGYPGNIPSISGDGHTVAVQTTASNLVSTHYDTNFDEDMYIFYVP
ncbi:MAG: PD40 domain-containing protein [Sandaracinaceae bacterium]|nr:PD40 domain-containing protein [Sandaracinaceae bacterium]